MKKMIYELCLTFCLQMTSNRLAVNETNSTLNSNLYNCDLNVFLLPLVKKFLWKMCYRVLSLPVTICFSF